MIPTISTYLISTEDLFCKALINCSLEHASVISNIFQSYVVYQESTNPEFASRIHNLQLPLDGMNVVWTCWNIIKFFSFAEKLKPSSIETPLIFLGVAIFSVSALALSKLGVDHLNRYVKDSQSFKDLIKKINISKADRKTVKVDRIYPELLRISQIIYLQGFLFNIALTYLSRYHPIYVTNTSCQFFCFWQISNQKWIRFSKTFELVKRVGE